MESLVNALSLLILFICLAVDCEQWAERRVGEAKQLWEFKTSHIKKEMNLDCRYTQGYSPCLAYTRTWVSLPHHIIEMLVVCGGGGRGRRAVVAGVMMLSGSCGRPDGDGGNSTTGGDGVGVCWGRAACFVPGYSALK